MAAADDEATKLQNHLKLLLQQYNKLQEKYNELERNYSTLAANAGQLSPDHFVVRLLRTVEELFDRRLYSDLKINFDERSLHGHRFVLAARSDHWTEGSLKDIDELDLPNVSYEVGYALMRWVYTDKIEIKSDTDFTLDLLKEAEKYQLMGLKAKCEKSLTSAVNVRNCVKFFQTATDVKAAELRKYCLEMIRTNWDQLDSAAFADMKAELLFEMFKEKSRYPLNLAIRYEREDIVFLFLVENTSQLPAKLNEADENGNLPIELALLKCNESIATKLVESGCSLDMPDGDGRCLLHKAVSRGDEFAACFLVEHGADVRKTIASTKETALHLAAASHVGMSRVVTMLLAKGANPNMQDANGRTALHRAVTCRNNVAFDLLLGCTSLELELRDHSNSTVLWLALQSDMQSRSSLDDQTSFAVRLVTRGSSPDAVDPTTGNSLLHLAAEENLEIACLFLVTHRAQPNPVNQRGQSPLHIAATKGLAKLSALLLSRGADPNLQTRRDGSISLDVVDLHSELESLTNLQQSMSPLVDENKSGGGVSATDGPLISFDSSMPSEPQPKPESAATPETFTAMNPFDAVLAVSNINPFDSPAGSPATPQRKERANPFDSPPPSPAVKPSQAAAAAAVSAEKKSEETTAIEEKRETTSEDANGINQKLALIENLATLLREVPRQHSSNKTPLHLAVQNRHKEVVQVFLNHKTNSTHPAYIRLNYDVMDGEEQTALGLALWTGQLDVAEQLVVAGADVESKTRQGLTLLMQALLRGDGASVTFLLDKRADVGSTAFDLSALQLAIHLRLPDVVDALCKHGANLNQVDQKGDPPLWVALHTKQDEIAAALVVHRCDVNMWHVAPGGYLRTLVHRAIEDRNSDAACFLIRCNGSDFSRPRQINPSQRTASPPPEAIDGSTPIHMASALGLDMVVQCLMEHQANVNARDAEGRGPFHVAILNKQKMCSQLLMSHPSIDTRLQDKHGRTPFSAAMTVKDNDAANMILSRDPNAAHQIDNKGFGFMHIAVQKGDVESVLFLMSVGASVNERIQNATQLAPLHLAVERGLEIICRHLLLAGADVTAVNHHKQTPLHVAAVSGHASIVGILLDNGADPNALDDSYNNVFHVALYFGHLNVVRRLLDSNVTVDAVNMRGQTPLHILSEQAKDNAHVIFETIMECIPHLNVNVKDAEGNTPLLMAYLSGAATLCRSLIKCGAHPGIPNRHSVTLFNAPVATKMLLWKLLDMLPREPEWMDGSVCQNCGTNFKLTTRKHHCRHCGRLLDAKCSHRQIPLIKFGLMKPVRVCEVCFEVLTSGASR